MKSKARTIGLITGLLVMATGCRKPPPPPPPPPPPVWQVPAERTDQVRELSERVEEYKTTVAQLDGKSTEQHQRDVAGILDNLSKILRLAQGSVEAPQFRNRVNVIEDGQAVLAQPDMQRSRAEASENEAVRASLDILEPIVTRVAGDDKELPSLLNTARVKLDAMYSATGPMHDLAADDGLQAVSRILEQLSKDLFAQFGEATPTQ
jgi:hypothetical protein